MESWLLLLLCGAATYLWRGPGVLISTGVDVKGRVFLWVSCVAYAIIAGLVSRMLLMPTGVLAETTGLERTLGAAAALIVFFRLTRRNLFAGVAAGALAVLLLRQLPLSGLL
jgi:branched-subunit amino acid transport protein